jgi:hypothetical protein
MSSKEGGNGEDFHHKPRPQLPRHLILPTTVVISINGRAHGWDGKKTCLRERNWLPASARSWDIWHRPAFPAKRFANTSKSLDTGRRDHTGSERNPFSKKEKHRKILFAEIDDEGGPLIHSGLSEEQQRSFDSTCRKTSPLSQSFGSLNRNRPQIPRTRRKIQQLETADQEFGRRSRTDLFRSQPALKHRKSVEYGQKNVPGSHCQ